MLGEYAVLFGAPAAVMAVNRRAVVTVHDDPAERWLVTAPGLDVDSAKCVVGPTGGVIWGDPEAGGRLVVVERVLEGLAARGLVDPLDDAAAGVGTGYGGILQHRARRTHQARSRFKRRTHGRPGRCCDRTGSWTARSI